MPLNLYLHIKYINVKNVSKFLNIKIFLRMTSGLTAEGEVPSTSM